MSTVVPAVRGFDRNEPCAGQHPDHRHQRARQRVVRGPGLRGAGAAGPGPRPPRPGPAAGAGDAVLPDGVGAEVLRRRPRRSACGPWSARSSTSTRSASTTSPTSPPATPCAPRSLYGMAAFCVARLAHDFRQGMTAYGVAVVLILAISATRIYLGAHYPMDVLGGWMAGARARSRSSWPSTSCGVDERAASARGGGGGRALRHAASAEWRCLGGRRRRAGADRCSTSSTPRSSRSSSRCTTPSATSGSPWRSRWRRSWRRSRRR